MHNIHSLRGLAYLRDHFEFVFFSQTASCIYDWHHLTNNEAKPSTKLWFSNWCNNKHLFFCLLRNKMLMHFTHHCRVVCGQEAYRHNSYLLLFFSILPPPHFPLPCSSPEMVTVCQITNIVGICIVYWNIEFQLMTPTKRCF